MRITFAVLMCLFVFSTCREDSDFTAISTAPVVESSAIEAAFGDRLSINPPANYSEQNTPGYVNRDNTTGNPISDRGATLGRVLFYDKELSVARTISCASCHQQANAFGDSRLASTGSNGTTGRHSMRLVNARYSDESRFFWNERAVTLENQTTQPIQDHIEMGFSGIGGDAGFEDLVDRLSAIGYYQELFVYAYGDDSVSEIRIQNALAQFVRSIESFDARYDEGRAAVNNDNNPFPNFSAAENRGKQLFLGAPDFDNQGQRIRGGLNCGACHRAPDFSIDPNSRNNAVIGSFDGTPDLTNTRSPSLRDVFLPNGQDNGPFMHDGSLATMNEVLNHYNAIPNNNPQLDNRLRTRNTPQRLQLTDQERADVIAFLRTLTGSGVYTDERWSDPF